MQYYTIVKVMSMKPFRKSVCSRPHCSCLLRASFSNYNYLQLSSASFKHNIYTAAEMFVTNLIY